MGGPMRRATAPIIALAALASLAGCSSGSGASSAAGDAGQDAPLGDGHEAGIADDAGDADAVVHEGGDATMPPAADGGTLGETDGSGGDAGDGPSDACAPFGAPGECMTTTACAALGDHTSYPGYCPGPTDVQCCIVTPSVSNNPPPPAGWVLMQQVQVTTAMTNWAVAILDDPTDYPMFSTTTMTFGTQLILARVEWHPPDTNNETVHRGVTLYEQAD
jgi:hypothetical protein